VTFVTLAWLSILAAGVPLVAYDLVWLRLPDAIVLPLGVVVLTLLGGAAVAGAGAAPFARAVAAGALVGVGYAVLAVLPRAALGFGDVKLAAVLGCALGWFSWRAALLGAVLPYVLAGPVALVLLATGRAHRHTALPFGPWLLLGAVVALLVR
jgi:leader peptidase (prepilin peptidase)/N-methyltransferase